MRLSWASTKYGGPSVSSSVRQTTLRSWRLYVGGDQASANLCAEPRGWRPGAVSRSPCPCHFPLRSLASPHSNRWWSGPCPWSSASPATEVSPASVPRVPLTAHRTAPIPRCIPSPPLPQTNSWSRAGSSGAGAPASLSWRRPRPGKYSKRLPSTFTTTLCVQLPFQARPCRLLLRSCLTDPRPQQAKRDATLARSLQKDELAGVMDISDTFLAELRLNAEFNSILARGGGWGHALRETAQAVNARLMRSRPPFARDQPARVQAAQRQRRHVPSLFKIDRQTYVPGRGSFCSEPGAFAAVQGLSTHSLHFFTSRWTQAAAAVQERAQAARKARERGGGGAAAVAGRLGQRRRRDVGLRPREQPRRAAAIQLWPWTSTGRRPRCLCCQWRRVSNQLASEPGSVSFPRLAHSGQAIYKWHV